MITKRKLLTALCATVLCSASIAMAQAPTDADKHFVRDAIEGGNGEVQLGQLAQQKAASPDVKEFGQKMVTDHTRLGEQMKTVAGNIGMTVPSGTSVGGKATAAELKLLSGDSFDKAYIKAMVKGHRDDLQAFQKEATTGFSPEVRNAAKKGAGVVQHHLEMAEQIAKNHNVDIDK
jgi:putative membrane protein